MEQIQIVDVPGVGAHSGTDAEDIVEVIPLESQKRILERIVKHIASLGRHLGTDADKIVEVILLKLQERTQDREKHRKPRNTSWDGRRLNC